MGRNAGHTEEQVFEACDKLAADGQEVTLNLLRDALGGGSYSTLGKRIEAWQLQRKAAPLPVALPMPDFVKTAFAQCWAAAANEAGKEIAVIREKSDAEIKTAQGRAADTMKAIEQLEEELEAEVSRREVAEEALKNERLASQEATSGAAAREAALSATVEQMRRQIESAHIDLARQREDAARLQSQLTEAGEKMDAANVRERVLIKESATANAEAVRLSDQLKDQKERSMEVIGRLEKAKQRVESDVSASRKEARDLAAQLGKATGSLESLRIQVTEQTGVIKKFATAAQVRKPENPNDRS